MKYKSTQTSYVIKCALMVSVPIVLVLCAAIIYMARFTNAFDGVKSADAFACVDTSKPDDVLLAKAYESIVDGKYDLAMEYASSIRDEAARIIMVSSVKQARELHNTVTESIMPDIGAAIEEEVEDDTIIIAKAYEAAQENKYDLAMEYANKINNEASKIILVSALNKRRNASIAASNAVARNNETYEKLKRERERKRIEAENERRERYERFKSENERKRLERRERMRKLEEERQERIRKLNQ